MISRSENDLLRSPADPVRVVRHCGQDTCHGDRPLWQNSPAIPKRPGTQKSLGGTKFCHAVHYLCACRLQYTSLKYNLLRLVRPPRKEPAGSLFSFFNLFKQVHSDWKKIHCTWEKPMTLIGTSTKQQERSQFEELWKVVLDQLPYYIQFWMQCHGKWDLKAEPHRASRPDLAWGPSSDSPAESEMKLQICKSWGVHLRPCYFLTWISVSEFQQLERFENH